MKIALDAGHGFNTAGKRTPDDIREWTLNDRVLRGFLNEIKNYKVDVIRVDDATGKNDVPLKTRTDKAHDFGASVYISFHHNAYQSKWGDHGGSEVWIAKENARPLAQSMLNAILEVGKLRNRGVKLDPRNFHVTREFKGISMLCEIGFMDSNTDKFIREENNSLAVGKQMAINFAKFYGLVDDKPQPKPETKYIRLKGTYQEKGRFTNTSGSNIYMRQFVPNVNAVENGRLANKSYVDYQDVYIGNGYVWVGNGTTWIPTRELDKNGKPKPLKEAWGTYTAIPKTPAKPKPKPKKEYIQLLKTADSWAVYPLGKALVRKNAIGTLNPMKFGGLEYEILGRVTNGVTIQTKDYGKGNIYIGNDVKRYYEIRKR